LLFLGVISFFPSPLAGEGKILRPVRIEPLFQSLPAIRIVVLQRRRLRRVRGNALLWPTNFAGGYLLQQNTNLASTNWVTSSNAMILTGGTNQVTVPTTTGNLFFRLYHP